MKGKRWRCRSLWDGGTSIISSVGLVLWYQGRLDEALQYFRTGWEIEPVSFESGQLSQTLLPTLAMMGDAQAGTALADARRYLPEVGKPLYVGACGCFGARG
jgi:hypothetical protein